MAKRKIPTTLKEVLAESGLAVKEYRTLNCGCGIVYAHPVIIDKKTKEQTPLNVETFNPTFLRK